MDSLVLRNFHDYWEDPLINKYLGGEASKHFEGILIVKKKNKPIWISHPFNYTQAKKLFAKQATVKKYNTINDIKKILQKETGRIVGYNPRHQTVTSFKNLKRFLKGKILVDAEEALETDREIKTPSEIRRIAKAAKETRKIILLLQNWLKEGITEKQTEEKIREQFKQDGYETAFCTVAFGKNTSHIHHASSGKKLSIGPVLIDTGAKYEGYNSDLSRTFWFGEKKSKQYEKFVVEKKKVEGCLEKIEKKIMEGTNAKELWEYTQPIGELPHSLGHGVGLEVHDFPSGIGKKSNWKLKAGMILAIEPALYEKSFGIRIEDTYLITKKGFKKL